MQAGTAAAAVHFVQAGFVSAGFVQAGTASVPVRYVQSRTLAAPAVDAAPAALSAGLISFFSPRPIAF